MTYFYFVTISLLLAAVSWADTASVERTIYFSECTYIKQGAATSNYGTATSILIGTYYDFGLEGNAYYRSILGNDSAIIDAISEDTIVNNLCDSAKLYFYVSSETNEGGETLFVWAIKKHWAELQSSWNNCTTGTAWTTVGCASVGNDLYDMKACSVAFSTSGDKWGHIKQLGDSLCADGAYAFEGIRFHLNTDLTESDVATIASDDNATQAQWPYMKVWYRRVYTPPPIPDYVHGPDGAGVLHSPDGSSRRHGPA